MLREKGMMLQETAANESYHDAGNETAEPLESQKITLLSPKLEGD
jgi:hypothetical protein